LLRDLKISKESKLGKRLVAADLDYNKVTKSYWVYGVLDINLPERRFRLHPPELIDNPKVQPWTDGVFYWKKGQWKAKTLN
jgi:hypothetical protein